MRLGLFFTRHMGLRDWAAGGTLGRETALYRALAERGVQTTFFTYDRESPTELLAGLPGFSVVPVRPEWFLGRGRFFRPGRWLLRPRLREMDLLKTNQFLGGREAADAARLAGRPLVARAGYLHSELVAAQGRPAEVVRDYEAAEAYVASRAAAVIVTTRRMQAKLSDEFKIPAEKVAVLGNYVPPAFAPAGPVAPRRAETFTVMTVGRHETEKNYPLLIAALAGLPGVRWLAVGAGGELEKHRALAAESGLAAEFIPRLPNEELPAWLRAADAFVMCSIREGHPKALLEAMACGCACVGVRAPGIADEIADGRTGRLAAPEPAALGAVLMELREDPQQRRRLGEEAACYIQTNYSLAATVERELEVYRRALGREEL